MTRRKNHCSSTLEEETNVLHDLFSSTVHLRQGKKKTNAVVSKCNTSNYQPVSLHTGCKSNKQFHVEMQPTDQGEKFRAGSAPPARKSARRSCPDFLSKLVQILKKENPEIISWDAGRIYLRDPARLMSQILKKYFRHANYNSFKRQLNYFGFRKIDGKGKFEPCVYHNEELEGKDVEEITKIKRKTTTGPSYMMFPYDELKLSPPNLYAHFSPKSPYSKAMTHLPPNQQQQQQQTIANSKLKRAHFPDVYTTAYKTESQYYQGLHGYSELKPPAVYAAVPPHFNHPNFKGLAPVCEPPVFDNPRASVGLQCLIEACELHLAASAPVSSIPSHTHMSQTS